MRGRPVYPEQALEQVDVAFNALHGHYGEDGQVQHLLEQLAIPFTGSGSLGSAVAMNKLLAKERVKKAGIKTAFHIVLVPDRDAEVLAKEIFRSFPSPWVIKPASSGSSVGMTLARSFEELVDGIAEAFEHSEKVFIEDYVRGREATVGVIEGFRDEDVYALPPIEIIPATNRAFFDYEAKYAGESQEICPGNFTMEEKRELERLAKLVHTELDLRHYSRSDFIINPAGIYFLEVNTLPGLTESSLVPKAVHAVGSSLPEFLDHLVTRALNH
jgi:D-alanine-D-alanine ligase